MIGGNRNVLGSLGRMPCPFCGRENTSVAPGWHMAAHRYGPLRVVNEYGMRQRERCPGADSDTIIRLALQIPSRVEP